MSEHLSERHFPWHWTEFGVLCACGRPCDVREECEVVRRARHWETVNPPEVKQ